MPRGVTLNLAEPEKHQMRPSEIQVQQLTWGFYLTFDHSSEPPGDAHLETRVSPHRHISLNCVSEKTLAQVGGGWGTIGCGSRGAVPVSRYGISCGISDCAARIVLGLSKVYTQHISYKGLQHGRLEKGSPT